MEVMESVRSRDYERLEPLEELIKRIIQLRPLGCLIDDREGFEIPSVNFRARPKTI